MNGWSYSSAGEHFLDVEGVAGSIPANFTIFYLTMHAKIFVFAFFYFYRLILLFVSFLCDTIKTNRKKQKQTNMSFGGDLDDW